MDAVGEAMSAGAASGAVSICACAEKVRTRSELKGWSLEWWASSVAPSGRIVVVPPAVVS